jgi:hypothetical protein
VTPFFCLHTESLSTCCFYSTDIEAIVRLKPHLAVLAFAGLLSGCKLGNGGFASPGSGSGSSGGGSPATVTVSVTPNPASVRAGNSQQFTATVSGSSNQAVSWSVNTIAGGNASLGTITSGGLYTAPAVVPNANSVTIQATSAADSSASGSDVVTLLNPSPSISSVSPLSFTVGSFTLTINGANFVSGAQVSFGGTSLATTFVSNTQLTATGTEPTAGTYAVSVSNPNPGASTSGSVNIQVNAAGNPNPPPPPPPSSCSAMSLGQGASLNGVLPFPADNAWNQNIAGAAVDPNSQAIINFIGASIGLHPDFGSGTYDGSSIGIPYVIVGAQQAFVPINFTAYGDESDQGPMPVPADAPIEGYPNAGSGDRHVLVLDNDNCWLYELYSSYPGNNGAWNAGSAAVWDLLNDEQRPLTWTSADAAGLSIFAGLVRYDEVAAGEIKHAIRFTLQNSRAAFVPPASHWAANSSNPLAAPMGMRMRLKASFDISSFSPTNQVILKAMQQYGIIMADNGSSMFISGAPDDRWDNSDLHNLGAVTTSDFEVVLMNPIYAAANVPQGAPPTIASFTASATSVASGTPVTLTWNVTGASYFVISPLVGAVRGSSVTITPTQTATYTLYAMNAFGQSTATVIVTVH